MLTLFQRSLAAIAVTIGLLGSSVVSVRWAYGAFDDTYTLVGDFPRAGQAIVPGADVQFRGVTIGEVGSIRLVDRRARIELDIEDGFEVARSAVATVRPKTLFGEKYVELTYPDGRSGPPMRDGDRLRRAETATEVEDLIAGSVPLFERVDPQALATVVHELAEGVRGQGERIASALESGARVATLLADTIAAQQRALEAWARFQEELAPLGPDLNALSAASNRALPVLNRAEDDFAAALRSVRPLADDLADLFSVYRPDIDALVVDGDNILRMLVAQRDDVSETIHGLYRYTFKFGEGLGPDTLPDGTKVVYFKVFLLLDDIRAVVCSLFAAPGDELAPLRELVAGEGSLLACPAPGEGGAQADAPAVARRLHAGVATADRSRPVTIDALVSRVLEGAR